MSDNLENTIKKMVHLARLELSEKDLKKYIERAKAILKYMAKLNELDTGGVEATSHALEMSSFLRSDSVIKFEETREILDQVPEMKKPFIEVPKVIE